MNGTSSPGTLCIRADASAHIGIGHVMRCMALAQAWQDRGGRVILISAGLPQALQDRCSREAVEVILLDHAAGTDGDSEQTAEICRRAAAGWLVLDGYHFPHAYHLRLKGKGVRLLIVDDLADGDLSAADLVLNHNAYATPEMYPGLKSLTGSRHTLLRREFATRPPRPQGKGVASTVFITLGGSDPENVTLDILKQTATLHDRHLRLLVLVGAANPHVAMLRASLPAGHTSEILLDPPNLPDVMASADLAITAAGSTCWELACLGVPMLLVMTAENQSGVAKHLTGHEAARRFDLIALRNLLDDAEERNKLAANARRMVDGRGAARVAQALHEATA